MRTWMKNHGQQNKPLIISEYSLLWSHDIDIDPERLLAISRTSMGTASRRSALARS